MKTNDVEAGSYREQGFLVPPDLLTRTEVEELIAEAALICRGRRGEVDDLPGSSDSESDDEVLSRVLAIHFPHKESPLFTSTLSHPRIAEVHREVISPNVKCMQSILVVKAPGMPGQAWHQDEVPS